MVGTSVQLFFVISSLLFCLSYGWMNAMDKPLSYKCPDGMAISEINSKHDNFFEDRVFDISCRFTGKTPTGCQWTGYVNSLDQPFDFQCSNQSFLFGLESFHDNASEDRRWKYYCCELPGTHLDDCYRTQHSDLDQAFSVLAPDNFVMRGVSSTVDNFYQDRQYTFEICRIKS